MSAASRFSCFAATGIQSKSAAAPLALVLVFAGCAHLGHLSVTQTHTFLHIITQSCLTLSRIEDGTHGPTVEACNGSPLQTWMLRNYTRLEVFRNIFYSPTDYFL